MTVLFQKQYYIIISLDPKRVDKVVKRVGLGELAILECISFTNGKWSFNGHSVPSNVETGVNTLTIHKVNLNNAGFYECQGTDLHKQTFLAMTILYVTGKKSVCSYFLSNFTLDQIQQYYLYPPLI